MGYKKYNKFKKIKKMSKTTKVIFDIETVRQKDVLDGKDLAYEKAWLKFSERRYKDEDVLEMYEERAGLTPEFGMIVSIVAIDSINKIPVRFKMLLDEANGKEQLFEVAEKALLINFYDWLNEIEQQGKAPIQLIGHYIKRFDVPYVNTRTVKHEMKLHGAFKMFGVKPWDLNMIDTKEVWSGGVYGSSQASSLEDVCRILNIESPKGKGEEELDGSMVGDYFWRGKGTWMERVDTITNYCERDTVANSKVLNKMFQLNMI